MEDNIIINKNHCLNGHGSELNLCGYGDTMPHTRNISRGLAILLNEDPLLLDRFIDLTNEKLRAGHNTNLIPKPTTPAEREISFHQPISHFADPENSPLRIVGLTLTLPRADEDKDPENSATVATADIAAHFGDNLVLVETSTDGVNAGEQVAEQARNIVRALARHGETRLPEIVAPLNVTWEEMLDTLEDVYRLQGENKHSTLGHYLRYLELYYTTECPPVKTFHNALS
jgi:hypothetical protein